ncbi:unnamed protein product, partial [Amoebophrya sp. A120]
EELLKQLNLPHLYYVEPICDKVLAWEFDQLDHHAKSSPTDLHEPAGGLGLTAVSGGSSSSSSSSRARATAATSSSSKAILKLSDHQLKSLEDRITHYEQSGAILAETLSERVLKNYNAFATGMSLVHQISTEMDLVQILVKNGRRKLHLAREDLNEFQEKIVRKQKKRQRLAWLQDTLEQFSLFMKWNKEVQKCLENVDYISAVGALRKLETALQKFTVEDVTKRYVTLNQGGGGRNGAPADDVDEDEDSPRRPRSSSTTMQGTRRKDQQLLCVEDARKRFSDKQQIVRHSIHEGLRAVVLAVAFDEEKYEEILLAAADISGMYGTAASSSAGGAMAASSSSSTSCASSQQQNFRGGLTSAQSSTASSTASSARGYNSNPPGASSAVSQQNQLANNP